MSNKQMARTNMPQAFQAAWVASVADFLDANNRAAVASDSGISKEFIGEEPFLDSQWMIARNELWWMESDKTTPKTRIRSIYTITGAYVGNEEMARLLHERGVQPELASEMHSVCSIGFNHTEQRWYGWSHRAICSFGLGDMLFDESFCPNDCEIPYIKHGTIEIVNLGQARQAAKNFARSVS